MHKYRCTCTNGENTVVGRALVAPALTLDCAVDQTLCLHRMSSSSSLRWARLASCLGSPATNLDATQRRQCSGCRNRPNAIAQHLSSIYLFTTAEETRSEEKGKTICPPTAHSLRLLLCAAELPCIEHTLAAAESTVGGCVVLELQAS